MLVGCPIGLEGFGVCRESEFVWSGDLEVVGSGRVKLGGREGEERVRLACSSRPTRLEARPRLPRSNPVKALAEASRMWQRVACLSS